MFLVRYTLYNSFNSANGTISLQNYGYNLNEEWHIEAECEYVQIQSDLFKIEAGYDFLTISDEFLTKQFSGTQQINEIVDGNFSILFTSDSYMNDEGFILLWRCFEYA